MNAMRTIRLLVLLLGVAFFWSGVRKGSAVSRLKTEHEVLVSRARSIGVPENENYEERSSSRAPSRPSASRIPAERLKDELVAAYHRLKSLEDSEDPESRLKVEAEVREWVGRLIDLSPKELKRVVKDLLEDAGLAENDRRTLLTTVLSLASTRLSETSAELFIAHREEVGNAPRIFESWGKSDPVSAFAWLERHREEMGDQYRNSLGQLVASSAGRDPALALAGLSKLNGPPRKEAANRLSIALDDDERAALLAELHRSSVGQDDTREILKGLGNGAASNWSSKPDSWMNDLSHSEAISVAEGISQSEKALDHPDSWLDWMGKSLPPEKVADTAKPLLTKWINEDYEAAGEWINRQPAGDFRNEAAANYARMMAKRFPDTAKDWANSLPEGPDKRRLLEDLK